MFSLIKQYFVNFIRALVDTEICSFFCLSGLQIGFFLERAGRDYIIFERENLAGILLKDNGALMAIRGGATLKPCLIAFSLINLSLVIESDARKKGRQKVGQQCSAGERGNDNTKKHTKKNTKLINQRVYQNLERIFT